MAVVAGQRQARRSGSTLLVKPRITLWVWLALGAILLLGGFLRFYRLGYTGSENVIGNEYYAAAVKSMLQSPKNFFFVVAEPGGSVTVDKLPLGFWVQAASAAVFGVNGFALALPQALAGWLSIAVLFHLVKRHFGETAGLIAALVLAVTPVAVSVERNNTIDGTLVFTLLLAAWAFIKATETNKLRWLLLGGILVGVGFNIKMLQAFLPLPALYALYFFGAKHRWWQKILYLALTTVVLLGVSFSWAVAVDLIPPENRPYIGSSQDNTVMELIFGHNGAARLFGPLRGGQTPPPVTAPVGPPPGAVGQNPSPPSGQAPPVQGGAPAGQAGNPPQGPGVGGAFGNEVGTAGALRLFTEPLVGEVGWLLPLGLLACLIAIPLYRLRWPLSIEHAALVLWSVWLVTCVVFFSIAGFFHAYYMTMLGPPLAALVAIGMVGIGSILKRRYWLGAGLLLALTGATAVFQALILWNYPPQAMWLIPLAMALIFGGAIALLVPRLMGHRAPWTARLATGLLLASVLLAPGAWAFLTTFNPSPNVGLPRSGVSPAGDDALPGPPSGAQGDRQYETVEAVLGYLEPRTQDTFYLLATMRANEAAPYILETGSPVLIMGGFGGNDEVVSPDDLARMVTDGELAYILLSGNQERPEIAQWVQSSCESVPSDAYLGSSDQLPALPRGPGGGPPNAAQLYQCLSGGVVGTTPASS